MSTSGLMKTSAFHLSTPRKGRQDVGAFRVTETPRPGRARRSARPGHWGILLASRVQGLLISPQRVGPQTMFVQVEAGLLNFR